MGRQGDAIRCLVLQPLALHTQGDTTTALDSLNQALPLAEPEGYVRLFVDEGEPKAELLREASSRGFALDQVNILLAAFGEPTRDRGPALLKRPPSMVEPLSERELEVLRLLARGLIYKQVAEQLVISSNTVRHHTRNIYGKRATDHATGIRPIRDLGHFLGQFWGHPVSPNQDN